MHICDEHKEMLPEGIKPLPMPDTKPEAIVLLLHLNMAGQLFPGQQNGLFENRIERPR